MPVGSAVWVGMPGRMAALAADFADRFTLPIYGLVLACFAALFVLAARFLTLEADEAWILLSTAYLFDVAAPATAVFGHPTVTTGGLHLLVHGLLDRITTDLPVHRAVSLVAMAGLLWLAHHALRRLGNPSGRAIMGTALFAAVPGLVLQAGLATGEVMATLLLVAAGLHWVRRGSAFWSSAIMSGILLGLAGATRLNCVAAIPALVAYAIFVHHRDVSVLVRALVAAGVAAGVAGASIGIYHQLGKAQLGGEQAAYFATATGLDGAKSVTGLLQFIEVANAQLPVILIAGIVGAWFMWRDRQGDEMPAERHFDFAGILLFMGLALLAAWVLIAPVPHLRYLWPALACIWLAGVTLLLRIFVAVRTPAARLTLHGIILAASGYALLAGTLALANGDSLTLVYQAMGGSPRLPLTDRRFRAAGDQRALASFVAGLPASARVFAAPPPIAFPIAYLSGRAVQPITAFTGTPQSYLIIEPANSTIWYPERRYDDWQRSYTVPVFRQGGHAVLRIANGAPVPRAWLRPVGTDHLFQ